MIYEKTKGNIVKCGVCPRRCVIQPGKRGVCRVRENRKGKLYSLVYGKAVSSEIDPVEKKPFFHFAPGSKTLSVATVGCNLKCDFCQNWTISQDFDQIFGEGLTPKNIVNSAKASKCQGLSYTYTEPTIFLEYAYDTMIEAETGLYNTFVSNGYMTKETIRKISSHLDAINIDYKGNPEFYKKFCGISNIRPIETTMKEFVRRGVWVEVTNLIVPGYNDKHRWVGSMARWIKDNLGPDVPLHFSRFMPAYKLQNVEPTSVETIERAVQIARREGLNYVYSGNLPGHKYENTYCPRCGALVIERKGFEVTRFDLPFDMRCKSCGEEIPIKGKNWIPSDLFG